MSIYNLGNCRNRKGDKAKKYHAIGGNVDEGELQKGSHFKQAAAIAQ
ncbi:hypothetical protein P9684_00275 [Bacillus atrophaeus]|nr:hypothetical protein [Bacillus atrophaeus]MCY8837771.1 hypothetical protein [Bacillus atrophaeus]MED4798310.1 hypothetical protein [Bacillus atrophaeus]MED4859003.1 hypothetical protein [Bacillus atrophaeus]